MPSRLQPRGFALPVPSAQNALAPECLGSPPDFAQGLGQMSPPEEAFSDPLPNEHLGQTPHISIICLLPFTAFPDKRGLTACSQTPEEAGMVLLMPVPPAPRNSHAVGAQKVFVGGVSERTKMQSGAREAPPPPPSQCPVLPSRPPAFRL